MRRRRAPDPWNFQFFDPPGAEPDVRPADDGAKAYNSVTLQHAAGQFKLHEDLKKYIYDRGSIPDIVQK